MGEVVDREVGGEGYLVDVWWLPVGHPLQLGVVKGHKVTRECHQP